MSGHSTEETVLSEEIQNSSKNHDVLAFRRKG
ncbi:hypothetical protein NFI96_022696 [Prochilodus magdalenae]|nr:hypothetical protein NFI96_022696 [Prochilodus magdalenae]